MPMYEYVCRTCHAAFETYVRSWGEPVSCVSCHGPDVEKKLSTFATIAGGRDVPSAGSGGSCCAGGGCVCC